MTEARFLRAPEISHRSLDGHVESETLNTVRNSDSRGTRLFTEHIHTMSRSKRYTQNGAERIASTLRSVSCLCATDGGRPLHPPSADENEMRGTHSTRRACVRARVRERGNYTRMRHLLASVSE